MSQTVREPLVREHGPNRIVAMAHKTRVPEFLLSILMTADGVPIPGLNFPYSLIALGLLVALALKRRPAHKMELKSWVPTLLTLALIYVCAISAISHPTSISSDWVRRASRIAFIIVIAMMLATERLHLGSILRGLTVGLVANVIAFELHLSPDTYAGALTGWVGDKNKAGMYYAVVGLLLLWQMRSRLARVSWAALVMVPLWMSQSRTSMTAYAMGVIWTWTIARRPVLIRWVSAVGVVALVQYIETSFAQIGDFASRWGSDLLRQRIEFATDQKLGARLHGGWALAKLT